MQQSRSDGWKLAGDKVPGKRPRNDSSRRDNGNAPVTLAEWAAARHVERTPRHAQPAPAPTPAAKSNP